MKIKHWIREHAAILGVMALAAVLNFARLGQEGYGNAYYAAAVKSMLIDMGNFFFVAFDPGGFITVDKPPIGFWLQGLSASLFGFSGFSILLPQALAGVISVGLVYRLVQRYWGKMAGLLAALFQALTPIAVATSRNNTIDSLLVMVLLLAAWFLVLAVEKPQSKWLYVSLLFVGIGYNIKTLEAFMVLPAFYGVYLLAAPLKVRQKLANLATATALLLVVSLSWSVAVDLTPESERPYVGSSETNSELDLAFGYNGLFHFLGIGITVPGVNGEGQQAMMPSGNNPSSPDNDPALSPEGDDSLAGDQNPPDGAPPQSGPGKGGSMFAHETGDPGVFRLFNSQLGGQISWLLPLALFGMGAAAIVKADDPLRTNRRLQSVIFWAAWLVPQVIFFSVAVDYHRYYLVMMAPAVAALAGIGLVAFSAAYRSGGAVGWLLPVALAVNLAVECQLLKQTGDWGHNILITTLIVGTAGVAILIAYLLRNSITPTRVLSPVMVMAIMALLAGPAAYAATPILYGGESVLVHAGPELNRDKLFSNGNDPGGPPRDHQGGDQAKLEQFLLSHIQNEKNILAVASANEASQIILDTGKSVMAVGGFMGFEKIVDAQELAQMAQAGELRYFLVSSQLCMSQPELYQWITTHGKIVDAELWQDTAPQLHGPNGHTNQLYDLKS